jgi:hypothetical protein
MYNQKRQQNFIAFVYGENHKGKYDYITFERFACKRPETAARHMRELFENDLYRVCAKGAKEIHIYRTPDHVHEEGDPLVITDFRHT